jgi:Repeat of unknown function (DUF5648)
MNKLFRILTCATLALSASAWGQLTGTTVTTNRLSVPVSSAQTWTDIQVSCPAGTVALSGGVDSNDFLSIEITTLAPTFGGNALAFQADGNRGPADGWYASLKNYGSVAHRAALSVVCATLPGVVVAINSGSASAGSIANPGTGSVVANCPGGYVAVGGGVDLSLPASMKVSALAPRFGFEYLIDRPSGTGSAPDGWVADVRNESAAGTMKVAAVCAQIGGVTTVATGAFAIDAGSAAGVSAACPFGNIALGGGIDTNHVTKNVTTVSAPRLGSAPQSPVDRAPGNYSSATGWYGIYYNYGPNATTGNVGIVCAPPSSGVVVVYEFYNTGLKHYFRTSSATEANDIDGGSAGPNWVRTGDNFYAYVAGSGSPGSDVCRFYTFGANSHFYTAFASECASLKSPNSGWTYEGLSFRIPLPTESGCATGTIPVYRLYNDRFSFNDSNHRFTTNAANIGPLEAQGWKYEGVAFCALNL